MRRIEVNNGQRFNRWMVVAEVPVKRRRRIFLCRCDCGAEREVDFQSMYYGLSKSCGCLSANLPKRFEAISSAAQDRALTAEMVRSLLHYDPITGLFARRVKTNNAVLIGVRAGSKVNGYIFIKIFGIRYAAHRLAWLLVYGIWPIGRIDHINRIGSDNRIANLREATASQNTANSACRSDNDSGLKGVALHTSGRWRARCRVNGVAHHLGMFDTKEEAHAAYVAFASKAFGPYFCDGRNHDVE